MEKQDLTYQIQYNSLENGDHQFDFHVDKRLILRFNDESINDADINVDAVLSRKGDEFILRLKGKGIVELQCDRCLDYYKQPLDLTHEVVIRLAEETNFDLDEDYVTLNKNSNFIDIAVFIYEMITFGLPIRRVHPEDENGESMCNPEVVKYITGESMITDEDQEVIDSKDVNEDWKEELKDLLN